MSSDKAAAKEIWLPKSEMTVTVVNGRVAVTETMQMTLRPIKPPTGFRP